MNESIKSGIGFVVFGVVTISYMTYVPEYESPRVRALMACLCFAISGTCLLFCIRDIIREELDREKPDP